VSLVSFVVRYTCRVRDNFAHQVLEERPLSSADLAAGVLADQIISSSSKTATLDHPLRLVVVRAAPNPSRGRRAGRKFSSPGPSCNGQIPIVTNQLDIPVVLIAEICRLRGLIEMFFRIFPFYRRQMPCRTLVGHTVILRQFQRGLARHWLNRLKGRGELPRFARKGPVASSEMPHSGPLEWAISRGLAKGRGGEPSGIFRFLG